MGVLARWKGQLDFVRAAARLIAEGSQDHFVIVGDEIYDTSGESGFGAELRAQVKDLRLESKIHFTGFMADIPEVMNGLDILVHASTLPEPFGRVVIEGYACETPVIASRAGGILEIAEDGRSALLF